MMFITKTAAQVETENREIIRKNREHDDHRRAENTPDRRITKATAGAQRLLKRLERENNPLNSKKAREIAARMAENQKVFFDCETELAKKTIPAQDVCRAQAVQELLKKLPNSFPSESDAVQFAEKLSFSAASATDTKEHDRRSRLAKQRTKASTQILIDAEQLGRVAGLSGDIVKQIISMGELD